MFQCFNVSMFQCFNVSMLNDSALRKYILRHEFDPEVMQQETILRCMKQNLILRCMKTFLQYLDDTKVMSIISNLNLIYV